MEKPSDVSIQGLVELYTNHMKTGQDDLKQIEFEIRMDQKRIKKNHFDAIFKSLYQHGFTIESTEYQLRIQPKVSDIPFDYRIELNTLIDIQEYCQDDILPSYPKTVHRLKKMLLKDKKSAPVRFFKNDNFGFRSSIQQEIELSEKNHIVKKVMKEWSRCDKLFRYLHRTSLRSKAFPNIRVDMSEVRMSSRDNKSKTFKSSNVLNSFMSYEVEIEVLPEISSIPMNYMTSYMDNIFTEGDEVYYTNHEDPKTKWKITGMNNNTNTIMISIDGAKNFTIVDRKDIQPVKKREKESQEDLEKRLLTNGLKSTIKYVLSGIQDTPYPVPFSTLNTVLNNYLNVVRRIMNNELNKDEYRKTPHHFIGPSSYALQKSNLLPHDGNNSTVSIRDYFCVTDKADGQRKLLFISGLDKKIYFIDSNLNVQYTGCELHNSVQMPNTIIDGEHLTVDKYGNKINIYAAFDLYCVTSMDVRRFPFKKNRTKEQVKENKQFHYSETRYSYLKHIVDYINEEGKMLSKHLTIQVKDFIFSNKNDETSIFKCCNTLLTYIKGNKYPYQTDGIIFTSVSLGVNQEGEKDRTLKKGKYTWGHSFKWKPPEFNTIDFLTRLKKNASGDAVIQKKTIKGEIHEYYVAHLYVGYDPKKHGHLNSQEKILYMNYGNTKKRESSNYRNYKPILFQPTNPHDRTAHICHIPIQRDLQGNMVMFTEENELIEDDTIVEFRYEKNNKDKYNNWIPLRVRYDKTSDYKANNPNFGNAYHVANSNWQTIHNPIDENMLIHGDKLTEDVLYQSIDDQYYNRSKQKSKTVGLRNFHNLFVKQALIYAASAKQSESNLIDLAVGKAGDLPKWIQCKLRGVLGIDIAYDNIHNNNDGACARFINSSEQYKKMPVCMFIRGNTGEDMENGDFEMNDNNNNNDDNDIPSSHMILQSLMGASQGSNNMTPFLKSNFGFFRDKFDICSIQFALHYMFENKSKLHKFLTNVSNYTKTGKYFIGTCYDGKKIYEMLQDKTLNESVDLYEEDTKIWHIKKKYQDDSKVFLEDSDKSIGYKISVYQESINQEFDEYLVNFEYFVKIMEDYGFILASNMQTSENIPLKPLGSFSSLFDIMKKTKKESYGLADKMSENEKTISFLNQYFIFQKQRDIVKPLFEEGVVMDYTIGNAKKTNQTIILS